MRCSGTVAPVCVLQAVMLIASDGWGLKCVNGAAQARNWLVQGWGPRALCRGGLSEQAGISRALLDGLGCSKACNLHEQNTQIATRDHWAAQVLRVEHGRRGRRGCRGASNFSRVRRATAARRRVKLGLYGHYANKPHMCDV